MTDLKAASPNDQLLVAIMNDRRDMAIAREQGSYHETVGAGDFFLDFAIYCLKGNIDVETDGDAWHANRERSAVDNLRNNALEAVGWKVLRYTSKQINENSETYCLPNVVRTINKLGGLIDEDSMVSRRIDPDVSVFQPSLFD